MLYRALADLTLLVHLGFVLFVVLGGLLALRWPRAAWLHLPCALYGAAIELVGWRCPLTPLENRFRRLGGEAGYAGGFVDHYLVPLLYPAGWSRDLGMALAALVVAINLGVYAAVFARARRR